MSIDVFPLVCKFIHHTPYHYLSAITGHHKSSKCATEYIAQFAADMVIAGIVRWRIQRGWDLVEGLEPSLFLNVGPMHLNRDIRLDPPILSWVGNSLFIMAASGQVLYQLLNFHVCYQCNNCFNEGNKTRYLYSPNNFQVHIFVPYLKLEISDL